MSLDIRIDSCTPYHNLLRVKAKITNGLLGRGEEIRLTRPNGDPLWGRVRRLVVDKRLAYAAIPGDEAHIYLERLDGATVIQRVSRPPDARVPERG